MKNTNNTTKIRSQIEQNFTGLHFNEEEHKYLLSNERVIDLNLISTTQFLKRYVEPFEPFIISSIKARKNLRSNPQDARTPQYYRNRWKLQSEVAAKNGTRLHNFAECYPNFDIPYDWKEQGVIDFFNWLPNKYQVISMELRVYDESTEHAGTIDLILYNKETKKLVIADWKTNGRNIFEQYKTKKMKAPFKHLKATSFNKFCLQLSDYKLMIEKNTKFEVEECWVVWLRCGASDVKDFDRTEDDAYSIEVVGLKHEDTYFNVHNTLDLSEGLRREYDKYINN